MSTTKRWFSKFYSDSQDSNNSVNISWIISDSECEEYPEEPDFIKKPKLENCDSLTNERNNSWIRLLPTIETPQKQNADCNINLNILKESPLLNATNSDEESPILSSVNKREKSPVIGRRKLYKRFKYCNTLEQSIQLKIEDASISQNMQCSPDIIIEACTQTTVGDSKATPTKISPAKSEISVIDITPFPSQESSQVESTSTNSSEADLRILYHEPPVKKKKFKKGGLARKLQKIVKRKKASLGIWQYEIKSGNMQIDDNLAINFKVIMKFMEYGCVILKCEKSDTDTNFNISRIFFLMPNILHDIEFKEDFMYKLLSPYEFKFIFYEERETVCLFNASKFVKL